MLFGTDTSRLSFDTEEFYADDFSVDEFIQRKRQTIDDLITLRDDLGSHLKYLRWSLIELINQDYGQFVNLSSNLVGLDGRIQIISGPLIRAQGELKELHENLSNNLNDLKSQLEKRVLLRNYKSKLQFMRLASKTLDSSEKCLQKLPSDIESHSDFTNLKLACNEVSETKFLLSKCDKSPLYQELNSRLESCSSRVLSRLNSLLEIYGNLNQLNVETTTIVISLLFMFKELDAEEKAEEIFVQKILRPKCEESLTKRGNMSALLDEVEILINTSPVMIICLQNAEDHPWLEKYNFLTKGIFPYVVNLLCKHFPHIWSPSSPDSFHSNWTRCESFITKLEETCPSLDKLEDLRNSDSFKDFVSKWQFPVYFQLRFHTLAFELESSLENLLDPLPSDSSSSFQFIATNVLVKVINQCWDREKIFIIQLAGRFLKASALFISRFLNEIQRIIKEKNVKEPEVSSQLISVHYDLHLSELMIIQILKEKIDEIKEFYNGLNEKNEETDKFLQDFSLQWEDARKVIEGKLVEKTVSESNRGIGAVTEVPRLFRRTNRDAPTKKSDYVDTILTPIKTLKDETKSKGNIWDKISNHIGNKVLHRYSAQVQELLTSVQRMEESLKRLKKVKGQQQSNNKSTTLSDDDKIRLQIQIDVQYFSNQIKELCSVNTEELLNLMNLMNEKIKLSNE